MEEGPSRKFAVLLHADVVGSTTVVQLDETLAHQNAFKIPSDVFLKPSLAMTGMRTKFEVTH